MVLNEHWRELEYKLPLFTIEILPIMISSKLLNSYMLKHTTGTLEIGLCTI